MEINEGGLGSEAEALLSDPEIEEFAARKVWTGVNSLCGYDFVKEARPGRNKVVEDNVVSLEGNVLREVEIDVSCALDYDDCTFDNDPERVCTVQITVIANEGSISAYISTDNSGFQVWSVMEYTFSTSAGNLYESAACCELRDFEGDECLEDLSDEQLALAKHLHEPRSTQLAVGDCRAIEEAFIFLGASYAE